MWSQWNNHTKPSNPSLPVFSFGSKPPSPSPCPSLLEDHPSSPTRYMVLIESCSVHCGRRWGYVLGGWGFRRGRVDCQKFWLEGALHLCLRRCGLGKNEQKVQSLNSKLMPRSSSETTGWYEMKSNARFNVNTAQEFEDLNIHVHINTLKSWSASPERENCSTRHPFCCRPTNMINNNRLQLIERHWRPLNRLYLVKRER